MNSPLRNFEAAPVKEPKLQARPRKATVSENMARLTMQERLARANGFAMKPPIFALGTPVIDLGVQNLKRSRQEFDALPDAEVVFSRFIDRVVAEMRKDFTVSVRDLTLREDGILASPFNGNLLLNGTASLRSLLERTPCEEPSAAATYLATIPADRRAREVNEWIKGTDQKVTAVLRTRNARDTYNDTVYGREVYAVVTEKYTTGQEVDVLARYLRSLLIEGLFPYGAKGTVEYDGQAATIKAIWHTDINPEDACAGEVFQACAGLKASDDRRFPIEVLAEVYRNLCLNFIIIDEARQSFGTRKHIGDQSDLTVWIAKGLKRASESVRGFARLWDKGRAAPLTAGMRDLPKEYDSLLTDMEQREVVMGALRGLMTRGLLTVPGYRGPLAVEVLMKAYDKEPEFNRVGLVNAITRAAHETDFPSLWHAEQLERSAGMILASDRPFEFVGPDKIGQ